MFNNKRKSTTDVNKKAPDQGRFLMSGGEVRFELTDACASPVFKSAMYSRQNKKIEENHFRTGQITGWHKPLIFLTVKMLMRKLF